MPQNAGNMSRSLIIPAQRHPNAINDVQVVFRHQQQPVRQRHQVWPDNFIKIFSPGNAITWNGVLEPPTRRFRIVYRSESKIQFLWARGQLFSPNYLPATPYSLSPSLPEQLWRISFSPNGLPNSTFWELHELQSHVHPGYPEISIDAGATLPSLWTPRVVFHVCPGASYHWLFALGTPVWHVRP